MTSLSPHLHTWGAQQDTGATACTTCGALKPPDLTPELTWLRVTEAEAHRLRVLICAAYLGVQLAPQPIDRLILGKLREVA